MIRRVGLARGAGLAAALLTLGAAAQATIIEPYRITISRESLPAGDLTAALAGDRVVHLSDLHFKGFGLRERRLMASLRAEAPDLILMTGDYADTDEGVRLLREFFSQIKPRLGIIAVAGNNDYYRGRQAEIFEALRAAGVKLLFNESLILQGSGGPFVVAGLDDPFFGRDAAERTYKGVPSGLPSILLAHSPAVLEERSSGLLFNAGDADGPWGRGSFWTHGSHFRSPQPPVIFERDGRHKMRIQSREDGVGVEKVFLIPLSNSDSAAGSMPRGLQGVGLTRPEEVPGTIEIDLCDESSGNLTGTWKRLERAGNDCMLVDEPDHGVMDSYPFAYPDASADLSFEAPSDRPYQVWVKLHSPTSSGRSDSIFLQWSDSIDSSNQPSHRIETSVPSAERAGFELVLAGHTHGGQVRIPWFGPVDRSLTTGPYVMGRYDVDGTMVYVSRGIGTSYLPIRFACAPEIVVLSSSGVPFS